MRTSLDLPCSKCSAHLKICLQGTALNRPAGNSSSTKKSRTSHHLIRDLIREIGVSEDSAQQTGEDRCKEDPGPEPALLPASSLNNFPGSHFAQSEDGQVIWAFCYLRIL